MRYKFILPFLLIIIFPIFTITQTHFLKPNGELTPRNGKLLTDKVTSLNAKKNHNEKSYVKNKKSLDALGIADTLNYLRNSNFNNNFGFHGQDVMMQFFVAPADMTIKGIGFSCSDDSGAVNGADVSVRLIKLNWSYEKLDSINSELYLGYYPSADSSNYADYFGEDAIGNWQDSTNGAYPIPPWTDNIDPTLNTFNYDLWSDSGKGINVTPIEQDQAGNYQWVNTDILGFEPTIMQGEVFAVVIKHTGQNLSEDRIGFWASDVPGFFGWKYYENGKDDSRKPGWWTRSFTWDFAVAVDLAGGPRIFIRNVTQLSTTLSTGPRTVEASIFSDNPSGGESGIESAELLYSTDEGIKFDTIQMQYQGDFIWSADIPGQSPGTKVIYFISATDINGYTFESTSYSYKIFEVVNTNLLVIFNGGTEERAIQLTPYYLQGLVENYDLWGGYGPVQEEMIQAYDLVLEIHSESGPAEDNREALRSLVNYGNRVLIVIGQEALGYLIGYEDSTFKPGDYEYDILGVMESFNDVNYDTTKENSQLEPSLVKSVPGAYYSNRLATWVSENNVESLLYDPYEILGSSNWMDQFAPREDINSEVFMTGFSYDGIERPITHNYTNSTGSKIVFFSFDPLVLKTDSVWIGNSTINPLYQFLIYHNIRPSVEKINSNIPNNFSLSQNYPNPFNPTTTINYSIPQSTVILSEAKNLRDFSSQAPRNDNIQVRLTVYDILGRKVATLVNQIQKPGNYKVEFDASKLTSGVFFYQLNAGEFIDTKKMLLIK